MPNGRRADPYAGFSDPVQPGTGGGDFSGFSEPVEPLLMRLALTVPSGFHKALAGILGIPGEALNQGLRAIGAEGRPFLGVSEFEDLAKRLGFVSAQEPRSRLERWLGRIGEEVGAGVIAAIPVLGAAGRIGRGVSTAARAGSQGPVRAAVRQHLENVARNPLGAATGELAASVGAGAGAAVAEEAFPGSLAAEATGQIGGSLVPGLMPLGFARRKASDLLRRVPEKFKRVPEELKTLEGIARSRERIGKAFIGSALEEEISASAPAFRETGEIIEKIPGLNLSLAERTRSPGLIVTQEALERSAKGIELDKIMNRRAGNLSAIDDFARSVAPVGGVDPQIVIDHAQGSLTSARAKITGDISSAMEDRLLAGDKVSSLRIDRTVSGDAIRRALAEKMRERSAVMTKRAEELGINRLDISAVSGGPLASETEEIAGLYRQFARERVGKETGALAERLGMLGVPPEGSPVSFGLLKTLRENITRDYISAASGQAVNRAEVALLGRMRGKVDDLIKRLGEEISDPELASRYATFRKEYLDNFISVFDEGAAIRSRKMGPKGFFVTPDENVADSFFRKDSSPGAISDARKFRTIFGNSMDDVMGSVVLDNMARSVVKDGVVEPRLLNVWAKAHRQTLSELGFDADSIIRDPLRVEEAMASRMSALTARKRQTENSLLSKMIGDQSASPEKIISGALKNPKEMQSLHSSIESSTEAKNALRRAVWGEVTDIKDPVKLNNFIQANEKSLKIVFGNEHIRNLKTIQVARELVNQVSAPSGSPISPGNFSERLKQLTGFGADSLSNRMLQLHMRQIGTKFLAANVVSRVVNRFTLRNFEALMREVLYDPSLASDWASMTGPDMLFRLKDPVPFARRLGSRLFNLGLSTRTEALRRMGETEEFQGRMEAAGAVATP